MLSLSGVESFYGSSQVLFGIDLEAASGAVTTLLGRNGMGKTTTIRAILGLTPPRRGAVALDGKRLDGLPPYRIARAGIGLVPEGRQIFPTLTVRENLIATARRGDWTEDRVFALFPRLAERAGQRAGTLSGGEQQMLAIGRGLMAAPKIVLFDEPSLGLSPMLSKAVLSAIRGLKERGVASLLVEQNMRAALKIADRGYVLRVGRITAEGSAKELAESPDIQRAYLGL